MTTRWPPTSVPRWTRSQSCLGQLVWPAVQRSITWYRRELNFGAEVFPLWLFFKPTFVVLYVVI